MRRDRLHAARRREGPLGGAWIDSYPELRAQWHPTRNEGLAPSDLTYGSGRRVWWRCSMGPDHEWQASPNNRTSGRSGCPYCAGRLASKTNNLALLHAELCKQWHGTKNGDLDPKLVVPGSARHVWWQCPVAPDHEWQAAPCDRIEGKGGCPFCLGMRVAARSSLAAVSPDVASEWHPAKNGRLTPADVTPTTTRVVWWRCGRDAEHEWRASVLKRSSGSACPECVARDSERRTPAKGAGSYVLVLEPDHDLRLALSLFLRSRGVDARSARDAVEARRQVEDAGEPALIVTSESEASHAASLLPGVPRRAVAPAALHAWLAEPEGGADSVPAVLEDIERAVGLSSRTRAYRP